MFFLAISNTWLSSQHKLFLKTSLFSLTLNESPFFKGVCGCHNSSRQWIQSSHIVLSSLIMWKKEVMNGRFRVLLSQVMFGCVSETLIPVSVLP